MTTATAPLLPSRAAPSFRRAFGLHAALEFQDFWRSTISIAFIVAMPVMFYVGFGVAFLSQSDQVRVVGEHTLTQANLSYAGVLTFGMMSVALANVAINLAIRRHHGLFKRLRTTPVTPRVVMGAFLMNALVTVVLVVGVLTVIGIGVLHVAPVGSRTGALVVAVLLGFVALAPLGTALSLLPPNADSAVPIVNGVFFPLAFLSGGFFPLSFGSAVDTVMSWLPGHLLMKLFTGAVSTQGPVGDSRAALALVAWGLLGAVLTLRWFRWASEREPRGFTQRNRTVPSDEG